MADAWENDAWISTFCIKTLKLAFFFHGLFEMCSYVMNDWQALAWGRRRECRECCISLCLLEGTVSRQGGSIAYRRNLWTNTGEMKPFSIWESVSHSWRPLSPPYLALSFPDEILHNGFTIYPAFQQTAQAAHFLSTKYTWSSQHHIFKEFQCDVYIELNSLCCR